jgi:hypothetical protein
MNYLHPLVLDLQEMKYGPWSEQSSIRWKNPAGKNRPANAGTNVRTSMFQNDSVLDQRWRVKTVDLERADESRDEGEKDGEERRGREGSYMGSSVGDVESPVCFSPSLCWLGHVLTGNLTVQQIHAHPLRSVQIQVDTTRTVDTKNEKQSQ